MSSPLELIITGNIVTMANQQPRAQAVGITGGIIAAVGSVEDVSACGDKHTRRLDMASKTIMPGFIDTHMHPVFTGMVHAGVDLAAVTSLAEVTAAISARTRNTPPMEWIQCYRFQDKQVVENRFPTRAELDSISSQHPIAVVHNDVHFAMLNTRAIEGMDLSAGAEGIGIDTDGRPSGYVEDPAILAILDKIQGLLDKEQTLSMVSKSVDLALRQGITSLHMKESVAVLRLVLENSEHLAARIRPLVLVSEPEAYTTADQIEGIKALHPKACVCLIGDGTFDGHTAATLEPYTDDPSSLGMLFYSDEVLFDFMQRVHRAGLQLSVHTVSDRAVEQALSVYEKILIQDPCPDHRHRFEHFELASRRQLKRVSRLGLTAGMQPMFIPVCEGPDLEGYRQFIGEERVQRTNAFRTILDEGILVAGGSDSPVTTMSALDGIQACLTHPIASQRITLHEAMQFYTTDAARIGFEEDSKGSIEPGKLADMVVLSADPYAVAPEKIGGIDIMMTIINGDVVYENQMM